METTEMRAARSLARNAWLERHVCNPEDNTEERLHKVHFTLASTLVLPAGLIWGALYAFFDEGVAAIFPIAYCVLTLINIGILIALKKYPFFRRTQQALIFVLPIALQLSLGGFVGSSAVIVWSFIAVLLALLFGDSRESVFWFLAFIGAVAATALLQPQVTTSNNLPRLLILIFFALNVIAVSSVTFTVILSFMADRGRLRQLEVAYLDQEFMLRQQEKLATLGTLAAGVAHELNNPAAAAARSSAELADLFAELQDSYAKLCSSISPEYALALQQAESLLRLRSDRPRLSAMELSDVEEELEAWLQRYAAGAPASVTGYVLAAAGIRREDLDQVARDVRPDLLPFLVSWLARSAASADLLRQLREGVGRVSRIVDSMRSYTFLDQGPTQKVDVREGLNHTVTLLTGALGAEVQVTRDFASDLPRVEACGSELNQVWTNIVQNSAEAMQGKGRLALRARREGANVLVEIEDTGPGMPPEIAARVFDPFFTTKAPGKGTGLGLAVSHNIVVKKHHGSMSVESNAGRTVFRVRLPASGAPPQASA